MFRTLSLAAAAAIFAMPAFACDGITVSDPYFRTSGAMARSGAAFMVLNNAGDSDCQLVGARSDLSPRLELHTHIQIGDGIMQMREVEDGFRIPAHGSHTLERGADHVMFMGLTHVPEQGDDVEVTLIFADGSELPVTVVADNERTPMQGQMQMGGHDMSHGASN